MGKNNKRNRKNKLWKKQNGLCCWCREPMINHREWAAEQALLAELDGPPDKAPPMLATLEHINDRLSPARQTKAGKRDVALACLTCNNNRGMATTRLANEQRRAKVKQRWLAALDHLEVIFNQTQPH